LTPLHSGKSSRSWERASRSGDRRHGKIEKSSRQAIPTRKAGDGSKGGREARQVLTVVERLA